MQIARRGEWRQESGFRMTWNLRGRIVTALVGACVIFLLSGCDPEVRKRPYGILRVGQFASFPLGEHVLPEQRIVLRRDERGFSAMSTLCTRDLVPLVLSGSPEGKVWRSRWSSSVYSWDGAVLQGPAIAPLPYYALEIAPGKPGGPPDTLYVHIGDERPSSWRLPVPPPPNS